jgi:hypothetical protein
MYYILIPLAIVFIAVYFGLRIRIHPGPHRPPVVCVCKVNGRVGIVLRSDYQKASRAHWRQFQKGKAKYDSGFITASNGHIIEVKPVFVFCEAHRELFEALARSCYVERAVFEVPVCFGEDTATKARRYLLKEKV